MSPLSSNSGAGLDTHGQTPGSGFHRRLWMVNPNTSTAITQTVAARLRAGLPDTTVVETATARFGVPYIGDEVGYAVAAHAVLDAWRVRQAAGSAPDAVLIACFGDPGLFALRSVLPIPVTGLAEAAVQEAAQWGRVAIVTGGRAWRPMLERLLPYLRHGDQVSAIDTVDLTGAQMHADPAGAEAVLLAACEQVARRGPVDAIVLGGAGLAGMAARLQDRASCRLIDSVEAAGRQVWQQTVSVPSPWPTGWQDPLS